MNPLKRKDLHWPIGLALGLGVVFAVNGLLLYLAAQTHPASMEQTSPYNVAQEYQKEIAAQDRFRASGIRVQWIWPATATAGQHLRLHLTPAPSGWDVRVRGLRADDARLDFEGIFRKIPGPAGTYESQFALPVLRPGIWFLRLELTKPGSSNESILWRQTWVR